MSGLQSPYSPPARLVGRGKEVDQLASLLDNVRAGRGHVAVISGEAGVGKTALVRQLSSRANIVTGYSYEMGAAPPYSPWMDILAQIEVPVSRQQPHAPYVPRHASLDRLEVLSRVVDGLSRAPQQRPLAVVLEDIHWADRASIEILQPIAQRVVEIPILLIVTYRSDSPENSDELRQVLPYLVRDTGGVRIRLSRLSRDEIAELTGSRIGTADTDLDTLTDYLYTRSGGNPFFAIELLHNLVENGWLRGDGTISRIEADSHESLPVSMPETVRSTIESRLARLERADRDLLRAAAVIGQDVPLDRWRTLTGSDNAEFETSVRNIARFHFMQESDVATHMSFSHALVRDAVYQDTPLPERQRLHGLAAEVYVKDAVHDSVRIAHHFARALDPRALEWLEQAAAQALAVSAPRSAIEICDEAERIAAHLGLETSPHILATLGNAQAVLGQFEPALRNLTRARQRAMAAGDREAEWHAVSGIGEIWTSRDYDRARGFFDTALELAHELEDDNLIARSTSLIGTWFLNADQPALAIQYHERALARFQQVNDIEAIARTTDILGMDHIILGDLISAERLLTDAIVSFETIGDRIALCSALTSYVLAAGSSGLEQEIPAAHPALPIEDAIDRALKLARDIHWKAGEASAACVVGGYYTVRGRFDQALHHIEHALGIATEIGHREWEAYALDNLAELYLTMLDHSTSREFSDRAIRAGERSGSAIHTRAAHSTVVARALDRGETALAFTLLGLKPGDNPPTGSIDERLKSALFSIALLQAEHPEEALRIVDTLIASRQHMPAARVSPWCAGIKGDALAGLGRLEEAANCYQQGIATASDMSYLPVLSRLWTSYGSLCQQRKQSGDAERCFAQADEVIHQMAGSISDQKQRARFIRSARLRIPASRNLTAFQAARARYGGLTPRQRDVAILIARGHTNASIAAALSISERTVEGHVRSIMHLLDFTSRAQIAAWAVEAELVTLQ